MKAEEGGFSRKARKTRKSTVMEFLEKRRADSCELRGAGWCFSRKAGKTRKKWCVHNCYDEKPVYRFPFHASRWTIHVSRLPFSHIQQTAVVVHLSQVIGEVGGQVYEYMCCGGRLIEQLDRVFLVEGLFGKTG